ncbi:PSD1 and planctomycete cytochrome C domain-containing protein [Roseimicrobium sp. ORNL1]|uniref:PSD1 and planctomycete cytochrome C domain-containing protein n=1 Tax=Roseimicrobium sp. ORNL1 TaxID=2711231 RepID=UPI001981506A|nr:PSD1 and planctomycete cytochrome C domain-containing protein [Roseimicrobium sp. ORNL1]
MRFFLSFPLVILAASVAGGGAAWAEGKPVGFNKDIRPILATKCYACHGPDEDKREGGLRLDVRAEAVPEAIVPGDPEKSEVWARIITHDADDVMPPPSSPKQLTEKERTLLKTWIQQGAKYEEHWSFLPIQRTSPPPVQQVAGVRNTIDLFIRAELEKHHLPISPEADAITLLRRVSLDLTGLPPSPAEVKAFLSDKRPDAYERTVERLLDSPHFGERWGRHWLDMARYADSNGFLGDAVRPNAWRYRDWVINAINRDLPFDEFTIEQLAGDLLPEASVTQRAGTGFHRNAALNTEAGVDKEEARFQNLADRVNTTGRVWMGLTLGCAQCHTHKYDPITIRDYYSTYAFFNNTVDKDESDTKTPTLAETDKNRRESYVHMAGDYARRGPTVVPASLSALPKMKQPEVGEATRLDFAQWLVSPQHPLTSRVAVNHIWSKLFGVGIVATPDDFGVSGESPSHPALLDWLATEFMRNGWSRKELIRLIVTSATYRQSSAHREDLVEIDPLNRLLARQNRLRLEAEVLRDAALTTSGLLTRDIGGQSIRPPLPGDIFDVGRSVKWEVSKGQERYRRGLYILTMRSILYPMLTTFDAPDAADACVRRERSNTPLQALTMMNDPVFVEATQALAHRVMRESKRDTNARLKHLFRLCMMREPRADEMERLHAFHAEQAERVRASGKDALSVLGIVKDSTPNADAQDTATLIALVRVLMNLDEFINRE